MKQAALIYTFCLSATAVAMEQDSIQPNELDMASAEIQLSTDQKVDLLFEFMGSMSDRLSEIEERQDRLEKTIQYFVKNNYAGDKQLLENQLALENSLKVVLDHREGLEQRQQKLDGLMKNLQRHVLTLAIKERIMAREEEGIIEK